MTGRPRPIGIAANPASGKDVRRLVARASVFDNQEKAAIVRRAIVGMIGTAACAPGYSGKTDIVYVPDTHGITRAALDEFSEQVNSIAVDAPQTATALDTRAGAELLGREACGVVLTLGGDGTNRAFVKGWADCVLLPISTGTNNVFPGFVEATVAGAAAAIVASGRYELAQVAQRTKKITVTIEGEEDDLALIDAVVTAERFIGSRALLASERLRMALLTRAIPDAVGMTAIGGLIDPLDNTAQEGLRINLDVEASGVTRTFQAPIAPGMYQPVHIRSTERVPLETVIEVTGPAVLAFDGERERVLKDGQKAQMVMRRDGPWVVDVPAALKLAAQDHWYEQSQST